MLRALQWKLGLIALGLGLLCFALCYSITQQVLMLQWVPSVIISGIFAFLATALSLEAFEFRLIDESKVRQRLSAAHPELEHSLFLFYKQEADLPPLQQLQRHQTLQQLKALDSQGLKLDFKASWLLPLIAFLICSTLLAHFLARAEQSLQESMLSNDPIQQVDVETSDPARNLEPAKISSIRMQVIPPAYTGLSTYQSTEKQVTIPEGSRIKWTIALDRSVDRALAMLAGKAAQKIDRNREGQYVFEGRFLENSLMQFSFENEAGVTLSELYSLQILPDQKPQLSIQEPRQYVVRDWDQMQPIELKAKAIDDYKIEQAALVLTVSRGEGESVKFREQRMELRTQKESVSQWALSQSIDLGALEMEPGDELYYYLEALDNKQPKAQKGRSDVYFISINDTTDIAEAEIDGMSIKGMPAYFRSQRQIINDTEELIAAGRGADFAKLCKGLAEDQKILRLRYGKFLGEEYESVIGHAHASGHKDKLKDSTEDSKQPGHDHADHDRADHDHADHDHEGHDHADHDHEGHDHTGHDHAGHDHTGHDHAGHDHTGHDHEGHDHTGHDHTGHDHPGHDHTGHDHEGHDHTGHDHEGHDHAGRDHEGHDHTGHDHSEHNHEGHDHGEEISDEGPQAGGGFGKDTGMFKEYAHMHDIQGAPTFFEESVKVKLKAALAQMWESELQLRLEKPEAALVYEYQALKLIKEVQQQSRIFVHKVGFEPPPIDETKKRYSGELDKIVDPHSTKEQQLDQSRASCKKLLEYLDRGVAASEISTSLLQAAADEMTIVLLAQEADLFAALKAMRKILSGDRDCANCWKQLRSGLYRIVETNVPSKASQSVSQEDLHKNYFINLYK